MKYNKDYKGEFFIENEENNKKFGVLKFLNGVAYIDLFGSFNSREEHKSEVKYILGFLDNGHFCIFTNCRLRQPNPFHPSNYINFEYFIHGQINSFQSLNGKKIMYKGIKFRLDYLTLWTGISVFEPFFEGDNVAGIRSKKEGLEDIILCDDVNYNLRIEHVHTVPFINPFAEYKLEQESWLLCEIKTPISFNDIFSFLTKIQHLFILMIGSSVTVTAPIILFSMEDENHFCYRNSRSIRFAPITNTDTTPILYEPVLGLEALKKQIEIKKIFHLWKSVRSEYEYPVLKVIEFLSKTTSNHESTFLNLVFALEKLIEKDMPSQNTERKLSTKDERHLSKLESEGIPKNTIEYFRSKIKKIDKVTLKEKVSTYLKEYEKYLEELVDMDPDIFINKLVDSRNHLAHLCDNCRYQMELREFPNFNKRLLKVLLTIIYSKLGINQEFIVNVLKQNHRFAIKDN